MISRIAKKEHQRKIKPIAFKVALILPENVSQDEMKEYILDAVRTMKGSFSPDYPIFHLDRDSVRVTRIHPNKRRTTR